MNEMLKSAIHKSRHFDKRVWVGCLTPVEALSLLKAGAKDAGSNMDEERLREAKAKGDCRPNWFYFYPNGIPMGDE